MVTIRLFASFRDIVGTNRLELPPGPETTVAHVFQDLTTRFPALLPHQKSLLVAVNEEYAALDCPVRDGDEVAFFPPVSGG